MLSEAPKGGIRLVLALIMGLALVGSLPTTAKFKS